MRLVIIVPDGGEGGLFQFYKQLVPALIDKAEVHVIFASPTHSPLISFIAGATCHKLDPEDAAPIVSQLICSPLAIAPRMVRNIAVAHAAWRFALKLRPDCIEVCDWPLGAIPALLDPVAPTIVQCHGSMGQIAEWDASPGDAAEAMMLKLVEAQVFALACELQTYSYANARNWESATRRAVTVIRPAYALGPELQHPVPQFGAISVFGRLQAWKGPDVLCSALARMGARAPVCNWYGGTKPWPGSGLPANEHLATAFPGVWGETLQYHPPVDRAAIGRLLEQSRAVIVPSSWDVFNFTAIEAMAAGRPALVSTGAGASELIEPGVNGYTFASGDAAALADTIDQLLTLTSSQAAAMGAAARATVRDTLDPGRIAEQRMAAYEAAIIRHAKAPPAAAPTWLRDLLTPGDSHGFRLEDFFDTLPAWPMAKALIGRARLKIQAKIMS